MIAISPVADTETALTRIAAQDGAIGAFVRVNATGARAAAAASQARHDAGAPLSPVDGLPLAVKDCIETADMPTEFGSPIFAGWSAGRDAPAVFGLREMGAVVIGKTVTTEFAAQPPAGTRNPLDPRRTPGGSSSGSAAAVAAGMVPAALGTQVMGSVLRPASYCGVIGFKPTLGAVNRGGMLDAYSQNCLGVLAASLDVAWEVMAAIARRVGGDPGFLALDADADVRAPLVPRRMALLQTGAWPLADADARAALSQTVALLEKADIQVVEHSALSELAAFEQEIADVVPVCQAILAYEFRWPLGEIAAKHFNELSDYARERLTAGLAVSAADYGILLARRERMRVAQARLFEKVDAIIGLAAPGVAPSGLSSTGSPAFNVPFSATGAPALSLPVMRGAHALPIGLQIAAPPGQDASLIRMARRVLDILGWQGAGPLQRQRA